MCPKVHFNLFGPSGSKAYTESILIALRDAGLVKKSPPNYFHYYYSVPKTSERFTCCPGKNHARNDKDIRGKYSVPVYNRFSALNF